MGLIFSAERQLESIKSVLAEIANALDLNLSVRLWNGELVPIGENVDGRFVISISSPGVVGALIRRPKLETLVRLYATGHIDFDGGDLLEFADAMQVDKENRRRLKSISKKAMLQHTIPFLFAKAPKSKLQQSYGDGFVGRSESKRNNREFIQFHYDVGNDFYKLFLGKEMVYTCGYFTDWNNTLDQAQHDKLSMICKKLQLMPGEKMLDIGCGWGGLICHAAEHFGVTAHGVTLSQQQCDFARARIRQLGLQDRVTVEICDYADHVGTYDKISSIGMSEHIGVANYAKYFGKINSLLRDRGMVLNHAIARSSKPTAKAAKRIRPERQFILKYVFPGSELIPVGMTTDFMEQTGFEVHDVESWRDHYALTLRYWCKNLSANRDEAIRLVGPERYRLWVAYLAGGSCGFRAGSIKIFQVVASKRATKGWSGIPLTRAHLYQEPMRRAA